MDKILTLAIPVYNMEKLLPKCLDSIANASNFGVVEVIVINDGSKDSSAIIAQEYATRYPESIVFIDKANGGWGSVINLAMNCATGKYFKILDSDDWFSTKEFEKFIDLLILNDADIIATAYTKVYADKSPIITSFPSNICGKIISFEDRIRALDYTTDIPMATICYRTELLKRINLKVADKFYADVEYSTIPLTQAKTILYCNLNVYQYYLGREDHSTSIRGYIAHYGDYLKVVQKLIAYFNGAKLSDVAKVLLQRELLKHLRFAYYLLMSPSYVGSSHADCKALKEFDSSLKANSEYLYKASSKIMVRKVLPYIKIWRMSGINILNLRKWI